MGQGTYGKVQLGINKETGQEVAIKTIKKSKIETEADLIRIRQVHTIYLYNFKKLFFYIKTRSANHEFSAASQHYTYLWR